MHGNWLSFSEVHNFPKGSVNQRPLSIHPSPFDIVAASVYLHVYNSEEHKRLSAQANHVV